MFANHHSIPNNSNLGFHRVSSSGVALRIPCGRSYRLVVVRKNISIQKGELALFEDIKYFFLHFKRIVGVTPRQFRISARKA
jgi:AraC-like DNA-binding protein